MPSSDGRATEAVDLPRLFEAADPYLPGEGPEGRRWLGRQVFEAFAVEYPGFFVEQASVEAFLQDLDQQVCPEVPGLFPGVDFPEIEVRPSSEADLELIYRSERGICRFAEGLIEGTAQRYGTDVALEQAECVHDGDPRCRILLDTEGADGQPTEGP